MDINTRGMRATVGWGASKQAMGNKDTYIIP